MSDRLRRSLGDGFLLCPEEGCGCNYTAIAGVGVAPIHERIAVSVDHQGIHTGPSDAAEKHRGSTVALNCSCESGHAWTLEFHFRKGVTLVSISDLRDAKYSGPIWRD